MKYKTVKEWLEHSGFEIVDNITAVKGGITVKFSEKEILSITISGGNGMQQVLLSLEDLNTFIFAVKTGIVFI